MPCTTLVNMCAECSKQYAGIRQRTLDHTIGRKEDILLNQRKYRLNTFFLNI